VQDRQGAVGFGGEQVSVVCERYRCPVQGARECAGVQPGPVLAGIGSRPRREPDNGWVQSRERGQQSALTGTGAAEDREDAAGRKPNPVRPEFVSADAEKQGGRRGRGVLGGRHGCEHGSGQGRG
jgi:hypothetical protein